MTASHSFIPLYGKRIRVTALDSCARYPAPNSPNALIATDGFISVKLTADTDSGNEILTRKADGTLCVNDRQSDLFKRFTVEMDFCDVNPALLGMVTNAEPYLDAAGDIAGVTVPEGNIDKRFALELWTGLSGEACATGIEEASGYFLLPNVNGGTLGDIEVTGDSEITFSLTGAWTRGQNAWGVGPYQVVYNGAGQPSFLPTALDPGDHLLMMDTGIAPPPSSGDPQPMVSGGTSTTTTTTTHAPTTTTTTSHS